MSELLHELGIDWKLLAAQIVNFAVLAFVLRRFAYRPLIRVLAERKERIVRGEEAVRTALTLREDAERMKETAIHEGKREAAALVAAAKESAVRAKETLMEKARIEMDALRASTEREIEEMTLATRERVKRDSAELLAAAIEHSIAGVLDDRAEKKLLDDAVEYISRETAHNTSRIETA